MLKKLLAHAAIILSAMYVVFFHIDCVNSAMAFIDNPITKTLLYVLAAVSVINAAFLIHDDRKKQMKKYLKSQRKRSIRK